MTISRTLPPVRRRLLAVRRAVVAAAHAAAMLLADDAFAQANACDQFKAVLASRIDPSIRGFSLEVVPADADLPRGAKVIGTCEGGARKILLLRGGAVQPPGAASAAGPASSPQAVAVPAEPTRRPPPEVQRERPLQAPAASASGPASRRGSRSTGSAASAPAALPERETPPPAGASGLEALGAARPVDRAASPPAPMQRDEMRAADAPAEPPTSGFLTRYWHWMVGAVLLLFAGQLWARLAHRRAYDAAGLPRGPRLN